MPFPGTRPSIRLYTECFVGLVFLPELSPLPRSSDQVSDPDVRPMKPRFKIQSVGLFAAIYEVWRSLKPEKSSRKISPRESSPRKKLRSRRAHQRKLSRPEQSQPASSEQGSLKPQISQPCFAMQTPVKYVHNSYHFRGITAC